MAKFAVVTKSFTTLRGDLKKPSGNRSLFLRTLRTASDTAPTVNHHGEISAATDSITSVSYFSGERPLDIKLAINIHGSKECVNFPLSLSQMKGGALAPILNAVQPSKFGTRKGTVSDTAVRLAYELKPDQFTFADGFEAVTPEMIENIRRSLVPNTAKIRIELDKLNLYPTHGHFAAHKDTPKSDDSFGSLVVLLPASFSGGTLKVGKGRGANKVKKFSEWRMFDGSSWRNEFTNKYKDSLQVGDISIPETESDFEQSMYRSALYFVPPNKLLYAAFFTDTTHSIAPILAGCRITLSYTIYRDGPVELNNEQLLNRGKQLQKVLSRALLDPIFTKQKIGIFCSHLYEEKQLSDADKALSEFRNTSAAGSHARQNVLSINLKNEDAVVAAVCSHLGLKVSCLRLLEMKVNTRRGRGRDHGDRHLYLLKKIPEHSEFKFPERCIADYYISEVVVDGIMK